MLSSLMPIVLDLLEKVCDRDKDGNFVVDETAYKRMLFHKYQNEFLATCLPYYQRCHRHFITRPLTFKSWATIIRQINRRNALPQKNADSGPASPEAFQFRTAIADSPTRREFAETCSTRGRQ